MAQTFINLFFSFKIICFLPLKKTSACLIRLNLMAKMVCYPTRDHFVQCTGVIKAKVKIENLPIKIFCNLLCQRRYVSGDLFFLEYLTLQQKTGSGKIGKTGMSVKNKHSNWSTLDPRPMITAEITLIFMMNILF